MRRFIVVFCLVAVSGVALAEPSASAANSQVYIISPKDGETVQNPVKIVFGLSGMGVAPAGTKADNTGHHHLIIDTELKDFGVAIPKDDKHRHFGGGQTETAVELSPGKHTLQLVLGDWAHVPHQPPVTSKKITINVK